MALVAPTNKRLGRICGYLRCINPDLEKRQVQDMTKWGPCRGERAGKEGSAVLDVDFWRRTGRQKLRMTRSIGSLGGWSVGCTILATTTRQMQVHNFKDCRCLNLQPMGGTVQPWVVDCLNPIHVITCALRLRGELSDKGPNILIVSIVNVPTFHPFERHMIGYEIGEEGKGRSPVTHQRLSILPRITPSHGHASARRSKVGCRETTIIDMPQRL